jgi:hypothetical protein
MDSIGEAPAGSAQSEPVVSVRGLVMRYARHEAVAGIRHPGTGGTSASWARAWRFRD